jgi:hypothetical protein
MWEITRNFIGEFVKGKWVDNNGGPPVRPVQSRDFDEAKAKAVPMWTFRMYDADGNLYYEGRSDDCTSERAFDPLEDYGKPNAGATDIYYLNEKAGKWEML